MNCDQARQEILAILDGDSSSRTGDLDSHLESCQECRSWQSGQEQFFALLGDVEPIPAPEGLSEAVLARIPAAAKPRRPLWRRASSAAALPVAVCLLLIMLAHWVDLLPSSLTLPGLLSETAVELVSNDGDAGRWLRGAEKTGLWLAHATAPFSDALAAIGLMGRVLSRNLPEKFLVLTMVLGALPLFLYLLALALKRKGMATHVFLSH